MSDATAPPSEPQSRLKTLLRRLLSSLVLWGIVLFALFSKTHWLSDSLFVVSVIFLAVAGLAEFYGIAEKRGMVCFKGWGMLGGALLIGGTFLQLTGHIGTQGSPARVNDFETSFIILFVLGLSLRQLFSRTNPAGLTAISMTLFGLLYVPWLLNFVQKIQFFEFRPPWARTGNLYVLYFILVTKFSDTGAYLLGSVIGRHKMIPRVSPGKTWEGFAGAILLSTAASLVFTRLFGSRMVGMNWTHAVILGIALSVCAVIGDLIESLFKREAGLKDSGRWFPGIGGILDLLDSLLFNAPIMYLYLRHVLTGA
jgi:phosphatidate cytidylyltransferase